MEQSHVEAADVVLVVRDVVLWAPSPALALVHLVCTWCAHITIHIQLIHADSASLIT